MNRRVHLFRLSWIFAVCLAFAFSAMAQVTTGRLEGYVRDPAGLIIPGVPVSATNEANNLVTETLSGETGLYVFAQLTPGSYTITTELSGFKRFVLTGIELRVGDTVHENVNFQTGEISETVQVSAQIESVDVVSTHVGNVVNEKQIETLPLVARNPMMLFFLQPGTNRRNDGYTGGRVDGLRYEQNNLQIEGVSNDTAFLTTGASRSMAPVPIESVGEYRVVTSSASAEFGRGSGAQVSIVYKSGTNEYHGSAFNFHRNRALNAQSFFGNRAGLSKEAFIRNQFGASVGGPIIKDRAFFNFTYEGIREKTEDIVNATVYTPTFKNSGIFRYHIGGKNSGDLVDASGNPTVPASEIGEINVATIDPTRLGKDSTGLFDKLVGGFPSPNNYDIGDGFNTGGHRFLSNNPYTQNQWVIKGDLIITQDHRMSLSYADRRYFSPNNFLLNGNRSSVNEETYPAGIVTLNSSFTPTFLNEFRVGGTSRMSDFVNPDPDRFTPTGITVFAGLGGPGRGHPKSIFLPQAFPTAGITIADNLTWIRGNHSFRGGIDVRIHRTNVGFGGDRYIPVVDTLTSGNPATIPALAGLDSSDRARAQQLTNDYTGSVGTIRQDFFANSTDAFTPFETKFRRWRAKEYSFFFQDTWKVRPNLTLNLGIRWEIIPPHREGQGVFAYPTGGASQLVAGGGTEVKIGIAPNGGSNIYSTDWNNFAPNVGFNWDPSGSGLWSISGNYRISYDRNPTVNTLFIDFNQEGMSTFLSQFLPSGTRLTDVPGQFVQGQGYFDPGPPLGDKTYNRQGTVTAWDPNYYTPYTGSWSIRIQREIMRNTVLQVAYVGNKGTGLARSFNLNQMQVRSNGFLNGFIAAQNNLAANGDPVLGGADTGPFGAIWSVMSQSDRNSQLATIERGEVADMANFIDRSRASSNYLENAGLPIYFFRGNPQFDNARLLGNNSYSTWNGLKMEINRRFSDGLQFGFNYTWSKGITDYTGGQSQNNSYRDNENRRLDKQLNTTDAAHVFNGNFIWEVPFGSGRRWMNSLHPVLDGILGGWQGNGIITYSSGIPRTLSSGRNKLTRGDTSTAVCLQDPCDASITSKVIKGDKIRALTESETELFGQPETGSAGPLAQSYFRNANYWILDGSIFKDFPLRFIPGEQGSLQFRFEFLNAFNHTNFNNPNLTLTSSNFGIITSARDPRIIQVALKLYF